MSGQRQSTSTDHQKTDGWVYPPSLNFALFPVFAAIAVASFNHGLWPITVLCWIPLAYFGHAILLAFHEASHGTVGRGNELRGTLIGLAVFVPLPVYRYVHGSHHAHLAGVKDLEMWPYVDPAKPRWLRRLAAVLELTLGYFYTPLTFLRGVVVNWKNLRPRLRRQIVAGYCLSAAIWGTVVSLVHFNGVWPQALMGYFIPAVLAGNVQSLRKFVEHMGLLGNTPETAARTIIDPSLAGKFLSTTMLNVTYHSAHHRNASLAYYQLPAATRQYLAGDTERTLYVYPSYWAALRDMLPALADPKIGGQWLPERYAKSRVPSGKSSDRVFGPRTQM